MKFLCEEGKRVIDLEENRFLKSDQVIRELNPELADWLWNNRSISYERYWEIAIAALRKTVWSDIKGQDMIDGTEVKTCRFRESKDGALRATVGNLKNKTGAIVVVIFHPFFQEFDFLYIPADKLKQHTNSGGNGISFTFPRLSSDSEPTGWWTQYRMPLKKLIKTKE